MHEAFDLGVVGPVQRAGGALKAREAAGLPTGEDALDELLVSAFAVMESKKQLGNAIGCCNDCQRLLTRRGGANSVRFTEKMNELNKRKPGEREDQ
jgi:hypothetical protein